MLYVAIVVVLVIIFAAYFFMSGRRLDGWRYVTLSNARGDYIPPGPVETECKRKMEAYAQQNKFSVCELIESRVGDTDKECPNGLSPTGCSICKIRCK